MVVPGLQKNINFNYIVVSLFLEMITTLFIIQIILRMVVVAVAPTILILTILLMQIQDLKIQRLVILIYLMPLQQLVRVLQIGPIGIKMHLYQIFQEVIDRILLVLALILVLMKMHQDPLLIQGRSRMQLLLVAVEKLRFHGTPYRVLQNTMFIYTRVPLMLNLPIMQERQRRPLTRLQVLTIPLDIFYA